jgi:hypothetical protein
LQRLRNSFASQTQTSSAIAASAFLFKVFACFLKVALRPNSYFGQIVMNNSNVAAGFKIKKL